MSKKCLLLYFVLFLCLIQMVCLPDSVTAQTILSSQGHSLKQIGAFAVKVNAERLAEKLKNEGFEVEIHEGLTVDNKTIYRVFASKQAVTTEEAVSQSEAKQVGAFAFEKNAIRFAEKLRRKGFKVFIREGFSKDNKLIYRVYAQKIGEPSSEVASARSVRDDIHTEQEPAKDSLMTEDVSETPGTLSGDDLSYEPSKEIASFKVFTEKEEAKEFAQKLREEGFEVVTHETVTRDNGVLYTVFAETPVTEEKLPEKQKEFAEAATAPEAAEDTTSEVVSSLIVQQDTGLEQEALKDKPVEADDVSEIPAEVPGKEVAYEGGKIASYKVFTKKERAEEFAQKLREEDFDVSISEPDPYDEKLLYTVFAEIPEDLIKTAEPSKDEKHLVDTAEVKEAQEPGAVEERQLEETVATPVEEPAIASIAAEEEAGEDLVEDHIPSVQKESEEGIKVSSQEEIVSTEIAKEPPTQEPSPVDIADKKERITADVFGRRGGYLHPFLSVTGYYTDNVFNTRDNKKSDFVTVFSPGIWLSVPRVKQKLLSLNTSTISPGGYRVSRASENFFRRYQAYLLYRADAEVFSKYGSEDFFAQKVEGLFQYNFRGGFSFELVDQFLISHDTRGTGVSTELDKYRSNLANVRLRYDTGHRLWLQFDYANFYVKYDDTRNEFRKRTDHSLSGYIFYRLKPKTSAFFQYQYIDIDYSENALSNSEEQNIFGGVSWDITAKSRGSIKAGYGTKDFSEKSIDRSSHFIMEAQIDHRFTPKTSAMLSGWIKTNETNISTTNYILTHGLDLGFSRQFSGRIMGNLRLSYLHDTYKEELTFGTETKERKDKYYIGTIGFNYKFREWLGTGVGYTFTERNSTFSDFNYKNNMFWFNITGSL